VMLDLTRDEAALRAALNGKWRNRLVAAEKASSFPPLFHFRFLHPLPLLSLSLSFKNIHMYISKTFQRWSRTF